jgi:hypothetical protein
LIVAEHVEWRPEIQHTSEAAYASEPEEKFAACF